MIEVFLVQRVVLTMTRAEQLFDVDRHREASFADGGVDHTVMVREANSIRTLAAQTRQAFV